jgi:hypothetical protein
VNVHWPVKAHFSQKKNTRSLLDPIKDSQSILGCLQDWRISLTTFEELPPSTNHRIYKHTWRCPDHAIGLAKETQTLTSVYAFLAYA